MLFDLFISDILGLNSWEYISKKLFELPHIRKCQFGESIDPNCFDNQLTFNL